MVRSRSPRVALIALTLGLVATSFGAAVIGATTHDAAADSTHHAAVIVDTGGDVHKVVISFTEDSISGIDALQRAGGGPVVYTFGGQGGAVCRIFGVGRDAGPGCLGGQDGDNRYWAYFRAPAGSGKFTYSSIGGGASRVHDGDVEGWKFGTGTAPAYVSLASLLPPPTTQPPPTTPTTKAAGTVGPGSGGGTTGGSGAAVPGAVGGPAAAGTATTTSTLPLTGPAVGSGPGDTTTKSTTKDKNATTADGDGRQAAGRTVDTRLASAEDDGGGTSTWSLLLFVALLVAIVAAILIVRRVRKQHA
jgi:hypothetical protein